LTKIAFAIGFHVVPHVAVFSGANAQDISLDPTNSPSLISWPTTSALVSPSIASYDGEQLLSFFGFLKVKVRNYIW
jgi:hypothetical protein